MKTKSLVFTVVILAMVLSTGCLTKVSVSGGPNIYTPSIPIRGGLFPPQLLLTVNNITTFVLRVDAISSVDSVAVEIVQGQKANLPFRQFSGDCRGLNVTVAAHNPETGAFVTSVTRTYNVCGGQNLTQFWDVRQAGNQQQNAIF
ncbi:MAG TPA: hypothetical protein VJH67_02210 [Candidatus Paceibacterota bacterium]